jgi:rhomboid protease GluP
VLLMGPAIGGLLRRIDDPGLVIRAVIYTNAAMFALSILLNPGGLSRSLNPFAFFNPSNESLLLLGATGQIPIDRLGRWWTLMSANFLHAGLIHLLFNMAAFWQLSPLVARLFGAARMLIIYLGAGVIGFYVSYMAKVGFTIGASAAVCGLSGSLLFYGINRGGWFGHMVYRQILGWTIGIFLFGLLVPGINNWGHGGGIAGGFVLAFALGYEQVRRQCFFHHLAAGACALAAAAILLWAAASGLYLRLAG